MALGNVVPVHDVPEAGARYVLPSTRAGAVADELRRLIQTGVLKPGQHLRQAEIAKRFGASTTPVREAFSALAREGLVQQDAHRGVVVFQPSLADLVENYEIRGALEPLAAQLAAADMPEQYLDELAQLIVKMRGESDPKAYHALNRRFHATVHAGSGRPRLAALIESLRNASDAYLLLNAAQPGTGGFHHQVHVEHEAIAAALRARDGKRAARVTSEHLDHNRRQLEAMVQKLTHGADGAPDPG